MNGPSGFFCKFEGNSQSVSPEKYFLKVITVFILCWNHLPLELGVAFYF